MKARIIGVAWPRFLSPRYQHVAGTHPLGHADVLGASVRYNAAQVYVCADSPKLLTVTRRILQPAWLSKRSWTYPPHLYIVLLLRRIAGCGDVSGLSSSGQTLMKRNVVQCRKWWTNGHSCRMNALKSIAEPNLGHSGIPHVLFAERRLSEAEEL